jgi:hypothetical protein
MDWAAIRALAAGYFAGGRTRTIEDPHSTETKGGRVIPPSLSSAPREELEGAA